MPDLPTGVTLNIGGGMPKIDFGLSAAKSNGPTTLPSNSPGGRLSFGAPSSTMTNTTANTGFTFSSPIQKTAPQAPSSPNTQVISSTVIDLIWVH